MKKQSRKPQSAPEKEVITVTESAPPLPPLPLQFSQTQPLVGATLDTQSIVRDLLERNIDRKDLRQR